MTNMSLRPGRGGQPTEPLLAPSAAVSTAPTAAVIAAWFLWVLGTIFALVAMILAAVILSRVNSIQDGVDALRACCSEVFSTVFSILSILSGGVICRPLYSIPAGGLVVSLPGCWTFQNDVPCGESVCVTVLSHGVTFNGGGFDLLLGNTSTGFFVPESPTFRLYDLRSITTPPSNDINSNGLFAYSSPSMTIERCVFNGTTSGIQVYDADALRIDRCHFTEIKHLSIYPLFSIQPLSVWGGNAVSVTNCDFTHVDGSTPIDSTWPGWFDNAFVMGHSLTTSDPMRTLLIEKCKIADGSHPFLIGPIDGFVIDDLQVTVVNPNNAWNMLDMDFDFYGKSEHSGVVKNSIFRSPNASPYSDGIYCGQCHDVTFDNLKIFTNAPAGILANSTFYGVNYEYNAAAIHFNGKYSAAFYGGNSDPVIASAITIKNCHLNGAFLASPKNAGPFPLLPAPRQNIGIMTDGGVYGMHIIDTIIENMGGYIPANESAYIAQSFGGAIVIIASFNVYIEGCKIYNSANGSPQGGNGILFTGQLNITSIPALSDGQNPPTVTMLPATSNCTAINNRIFGNAGCAIWDDGVGNVKYDNIQGGNWGGAYCGTSAPPVVVTPGSPTLEGANI